MQTTQNPEGFTGKCSMQPMQPYLAFDGNATEAMQFYQRIFGGRLDLLTFGDTPGCDQFPPEAKNLVMHASLSHGAAVLMASDTPPGMAYEKPQGISLAVSYTDLAEAQAIFDALAEGGQVKMAMAETFWAERFGMATDRFGITWLVNGGQMKNLGAN